MIGVENIERERGFRLLEGCGVPAYPQKLAVLLDPLGILRTRTELHVDVVDSIDVDHKNDLGSRVQGWTGGVLVTNIEAVTQIFERRPLKTTAAPDLMENEKGTFEGGSRTSRRCNGIFSC